VAHYTCLGQALKELEAALEVRTDVNKLVVVIECGHAARHRRERSRLSMQKLLDDCPEKCRWAFETVFEQSSRFDDLSMETSRNNPLKGDGFSTGRRVRFRPVALASVLKAVAFTGCPCDHADNDCGSIV
jgi:hypothetical protein